MSQIVETTPGSIRRVNLVTAGGAMVEVQIFAEGLADGEPVALSHGVRNAAVETLDVAYSQVMPAPSPRQLLEPSVN